MIRTLSRLLYRAIIPPFLIALLVLTFVLFFEFIGSRSELLLSKNTSFDIVVGVSAAILPGILIFSLPLAYLIGILIGCSGLSGESQITALRACGIPVRSFLRFILLFGLGVGCITAFFSIVVMPRANAFVSKMMEDANLTLATSMIQPRVFNEEFPGIVFYVDDLSSDKQHLSRVFLADNSDPKSPRAIIARNGEWVGDDSKVSLQLHLDGGASYAVNTKDLSQDSMIRFSSLEIPIKKKNPDTTKKAEHTPKKISELKTGYLWRNYRLAPQNVRILQLVELNKRIALPFAVFPFAVLGLALAAGPSRGSRTTGFALSLLTVIVFYVLFFNGFRLAQVGKISPFWGAWSANILLSAVGLILFSRVEHGFNFLPYLSRVLWHFKWDTIITKFGITRLSKRVAAAGPATVSASNGRYARFGFPKVFDFYISRGFFVYFFWSLITCGTLFVLLTLFDLLDDIIRNGISAYSVLDYFTFLTPQILMITVPVSILLSILINFGILEKNSEITAIKAGGWSLYRISLPIFLIATGFCCSVFLLQDYILPYANVRQENIRNVIKGRPPQTSSRMQRKWIFGESGRIFNYEYFDSNQDSFVNLNVFDTNLASVQIRRWMYASRAHIENTGLWVIEDGWIRDYHSAQSGFKKIDREEIYLPEKASYFEREIFQPKESSKLKYFELKSEIDYLKKSGYNATELQVELHKKIAFPLSCLIMALLGIPFSFFMGKRGAFYGIAMSIAIAISFWGISGVFEALGAYGYLVPVLAAWAPNIVFGASGFVLLFSIRT
ncbi:MAG TPA: LptF/LptG family permease [Acidobacteriota bacterium]|nr:LptF/LptG family permease [Acidobacteriota bacterium]